jgi:thiol-disulfide isomerase/thioredoxin
MRYFAKDCPLCKLANDNFFLEWHKAIKRDLEVFKILLENYEETEEKSKLINIIEHIKNNIDNIEEDDHDTEIILKSTPNYFMYSFVSENEEMPSYVLVSKDYKRLLYAEEIEENFDDPDFNEEFRHGIYSYCYFKLSNNKVYFYGKDIKEYTWDYTFRFKSGMYDENLEDTEIDYDSLLNDAEYDLALKKKI